ncbi:MAG: hypothetical protein HQM11_07320 [SAR324 cluster bacterium]|nr:hypothetical protein [SAR324 cluster bacterium]
MIKWTQHKLRKALVFSRKSRLLKSLKTSEQTADLLRAIERFVPREFLRHLEKNSIAELRLGDHVQKEMTVLFADIRSFTTLSEQMSPQDNFYFINGYLQRIVPVIRHHSGFVDKYIGDSIMALFDGDADDALLSAIDMLYELNVYNQTRNRPARQPIRIGIGIHRGPLMLGTIGESDRMESTVISDAVNLASRIERMNKLYGSTILVSEDILLNLKTPLNFQTRILDRVKAKGKNKMVTVLEVINGDPLDIKDAKLRISNFFEEGVSLYHLHEFKEALPLFEKCLQIFPEDRPSKIYVKRCEYYNAHGWDEEWAMLSEMGY